jgi:predicted nucleic acid-binding protein
MPGVFVDTFYYIALLSPDDRFHAHAVEVELETRGETRITSDAVLAELLDHYCDRGAHARRRAFEFVSYMRASQETTIVPQTRDLFEAGLDLYGRRIDKGYSHTDCMSMEICRRRRIRRVLTHDHHFAQEGFEVLL